MKTKRAGGFGAVLLLLALVLGMILVSGTVTSTGYTSLLETELAIKDQAHEVTALMQQCRIEEQAFLRDLNYDYLDAFIAVAALVAGAEALVAIAAAAGDQELVSLGEQVKASCFDYESFFNDMAGADNDAAFKEAEERLSNVVGTIQPAISSIAEHADGIALKKRTEAVELSTRHIGAGSNWPRRHRRT